VDRCVFADAKTLA